MTNRWIVYCLGALTCVLAQFQPQLPPRPGIFVTKPYPQEIQAQPRGRKVIPSNGTPNNNAPPFNLDTGQIPTDPLAFTCLIPGLSDLICAGGRANVNVRNGDNRNDGIGLGYNNQADLKLLRPANVPFIQDNTKIGSNINGNIRKDNIGFGQTDSLFGFAQRNRQGDIGVGENGNYRIRGTDNVDILGQFLGISDKTNVEVDRNTFGTTATRTKGLRGILEEKETSVIDPLRFQFGNRKQTCILGICFDRQGQLG